MVRIIIVNVNILIISHFTAKALSFLYRNMSGFLDNTLPGGDNDSVLFGPVLSAVLDTPQTELQSLVVITFPHTQSATPTCVFWDFNELVKIIILLY